ncbi:hypothetical protein BGZ67_003622 [Mortierella alpina]|nr:hypothetical protein BGZ67_003622 [Mortierella alpina]
MEAAQHSTHVPSFPSKLRWRPYANGSSLKSKKAKKEEQQQQQRPNPTAAQDVNAKAVAHRIRAKTPHRSPVEVQLQWEEAETIESMSHGGHPHNQNPPRQLQPHSSKDSPSQKSTPLPSPPQLKSPPPGVALVDSEVDMGQCRATLPALAGDDLPPLSSIASTRTCQLALNALLENHRESQRLAAQPVLALTSVPAPLSITSPPAYLADMTLNPTALAMNTGYSDNSTAQRRKLSTTALLGMASTHELLESCNYSDTDVSNGGYSTTASTLTSPATTHRSLSLQSSPVSKMVGFQGAQSVISPMALTTAAFEMLVAQTPSLLAEGDISKQMLLHDYNQQRQDPLVLDCSPTLSDASTTSNPFLEFLQDLTTPFTYFSSHSDPLISGTHSSPWPSLFPQSSESTPIAETYPQRVEKTTQTESLDEDSLAAAAAAAVRGVPKDSVATPSKFSTPKEEQDPEWLAFLDEASPLFSNADETEVNDTSMMDFATEPHQTPSSKIGTKQDDVGLWNWTESAFKPQTSTVIKGHSGFAVNGGAFGSMGSLGTGGMVRSLRGSSYQQRSGYHTKAASSSRVKELASSTESLDRESVKMAKNFKQEGDPLKMSGGEDEALKRELQSPPPLPSQVYQSSSTVTKEKTSVGEADSFKGLVAMFRGLWRASTGEKG